MPEQGGLKAVDLVSAMDAEQIKFVWIMGTKPEVSMPYRDASGIGAQKVRHGSGS